MSDDEPRYAARGSTIYEGPELIGVMTSSGQATAAVDAMNARYRVLAFREEHYLTKDKPSNGRDMSVPQTCQDADGNEVESADCEVNGPHYVTHPQVPR